MNQVWLVGFRYRPRMEASAGAAHVGESYDAMSQQYFDHVSAETQHVSVDRSSLRLFAELVGPEADTLDAGCGPGHITAFLAGEGLKIQGVDISPAMVELAQANFSGIDFCVGELADLPLEDSSIEAIVSRHSIIHTEPARLGGIFSDFVRVLEPEGRLFLSFFCAPSPVDHGDPFDHAVCTAYQFDPSAVSALLASYGLVEEVRIVRQSRPGERPLPHAALIARLVAASTD